MRTAKAYCDGGAFPNPGRAGAGAVILFDDGEAIELTTTEENSTNQRAEILGAIIALEALEEPTTVGIVSDSMYLVNCGKGTWRCKTNRDLWGRLDAASRGHTVSYRWVRGHDGNLANERAHFLAERAIAWAEGGVDSE